LITAYELPSWLRRKNYPKAKACEGCVSDNLAQTCQSQTDFSFFSEPVTPRYGHNDDESNLPSTRILMTSNYLFLLLYFWILAVGPDRILTLKSGGLATGLEAESSPSFRSRLREIRDWALDHGVTPHWWLTAPQSACSSSSAQRWAVDERAKQRANELQAGNFGGF
jgi:hypothetical protein